MLSQQIIFAIIISTIYIIVGLFGNIVSIIIFRSKQFKKHSTSFYVIIICVINIITLFVFPYGLMPTLFDINQINCQLYLFIVSFISQIQPWPLVFCSLDRLTTVLTPHKLHFKTKITFQTVTMILMVIIVIALMFPSTYFYTTEKNNLNQTVCSFPTSSNSAWIRNYFKFEHNLVRIVIPFTIMIASSIVIVWKMKKKKLNIPTQNHENKNEIQLAKAMIAMDIFFIIFRIPMMLNLFLNDIQIYSFVFGILMSIGVLNNVFLFVIFYLFNKIYRDNFKKYIYCKKYSSRVNNS